MKLSNPIKKYTLNITKLLLELLVVFLGVSAGFLLQNQKEIKSNKDLETKYIEGLRIDAVENTKELKNAIQADSLWIEQNKYALTLLFNDSLNYDSACSLMLNMANFSEFNPQKNAYTNITNSGNLSLISDYIIRQNIVESYNSFENFRLIEVYFKDHISNNFMPFLIAHFDMFQKELKGNEVHKSILFKNIFAIHYSLTQQRLEAYKNLLQENEKLLVSFKQKSYE